MKTKILLLFIVSLLATSGIHAQRAVSSGSIQIASERPEALQIEVNGLFSFRENISGSVLLSNLMPGEYRIRISGARGGRHGANIFEQSIWIQSGQRTVISISANNRTSVTFSPDPNSTMLCIAEQGSGSHRPPPTTVRPISDDDLNRMLSELRRHPFDRDKLNVIDVSAVFHFYTANQLRQILALFTSDDNRLQCARLLIPQVLDPENLYLQANVFTFNSGRNSFLDLIRDAGSHRPSSPAIRPINNDDLNRMISELRQHPFDRDKLNVIGVSAVFHFYTASQLRQILALFTSDDNRLQCARQLISRTLDPENLYLQADVFTFNSGRNSFLNLIRESR
ncbi:MAG: DUF4476 domain-containing protein [Dysgonamonadaceae bacterium]|jgi:hypothetical protein|nr:DUF4476 domain-containing protein [Dysgonamonadaceae bacterium]